MRFSERCWEVFFLSGYHLDYSIKRASASFQHINQLRQIKFAEFCCSQNVFQLPIGLDVFKLEKPAYLMASYVLLKQLYMTI